MTNPNIDLSEAMKNASEVDLSEAERAERRTTTLKVTLSDLDEEIKNCKGAVLAWQRQLDVAQEKREVTRRRLEAHLKAQRILHDAELGL